MTRIHSNNYLTTLNGGITNVASTLVVSTITGFPTIGAGVTCNLTIQNGSTIEIVQCTSNSTTTITIVRAQEGTSASAFASGSTVSLRPTADSLDRKQDMASGTSTATATATTTLAVGSTQIQFWTGSTTQTVVMPATSTLRQYQQFTHYNLSSGVVTVQSSGANPIQAMAANTKLTLTCILTSGTTAASWYADYTILSNESLALPLSLANGGTNAALTASNGGVLYSTASAGAILAGTATAGLPLLSGSNTIPTWGTLNGSGNLVATTSPTLVTPALGTPSSGTLTSCTGLPIAGTTGYGTGVATALAANVNGSGAILLTTSATFVTPALGTIASGNLSAGTGSLTSLTTITTSADSIIHGLRIGLGNGSVAHNTAVGVGVLATPATGDYNTGVGNGSLAAILGGSNNTALGVNCLAICSSGDNNVGLGYYTLASLTTGSLNVCIGMEAGYAITTATDNTYIGYQAGFTNSTGIVNVMVGTGAGGGGVGFNSCVGIGEYSLNAVTGNSNTAIGHQSGWSVIFGCTALTSGTYNLILGYQAGVNSATAVGAIAIGTGAMADIATGATSGDNGPGIAIGSSSYPVGLRGDASLYTSTGVGGAITPAITCSGFIRMKINGTYYKFAAYPDA